MDSQKWTGFQFLRKMTKRKAKRYANSDREEISAVESLEYDFITIQNATNNFSEANKLGGGSFGVVYRGTLEDGQQIAVKKLYENLMECNLEFKNEVALMAKLQHRNLLRLLGYCQEGRKMLLVYEFIPNGGLDNILLDPIKREFWDWKRRYKLIENIARGLIYLHEDSQLRIIHYNLKASNVLLDADLNPKIADFDMARLFVLHKTHGSTSKILGTDSYMAPEYVLQGEISVKSNVFGFGVLVLEIISGQKIASCQTGESMNGLLSYAWTHWKRGSASNFIDLTLRGICPVHEITKCIHIALLCVQENVADRPKMGEVLQMLSDLSMSLPVPLAPGSLIHGSTSSEAPSQFTKNAKSISDQSHRKMEKRKAKSYAKTAEESSSNDEISAVVSHMKYELVTIRNATDNFSKANMLGVGAYGTVYRGKLENGQLVAVKREFEYSGQGNLEFKNEVALLARLQHRNLVRLLGYCQEGREMVLVYEFVPNGGLDSFLFDPIKRGYLDWSRRYKIIESICRGLVYLHEDSRLRIVHRNLNGSNVLLDADLNPKIKYFGFAWFFALDETQGSTDIVKGTIGYMAPEYVLHGKFSIRSDVYSFGVLVLEIISGQKITSFQNGEPMKDLLSYAWTHWNGGSASNVIDPMLRGVSSPVDDIIKCIQVELLCVQKYAQDRPTMSEVLQMLSNLSMTLPVPSDPYASINEMSLSFHSSFNSDASINGMSISDDDEYLRELPKYVVVCILHSIMPRKLQSCNH